MAFHVFLFLLVSFFMLSLLRLCSLCWSHPGPAQSRAAKMRTRLHRLLRPRSPDDCPACRLASTPSSGVGPAPVPVRSWSEVKSRRGAPKRVNTQGYACPNQQCLYFGITDNHIHALVGDGKHGYAERIQTFRCQACHTTFSARRHTPLYRLKTPSHQIAFVLTAQACGLNLSEAPRVFGYRQPTITSWLSREGSHAQTLHERCFHTLQLPHLHLDELRSLVRSSSRCSGSGWPSTLSRAILPVLHLLIHSLRQILAPSCLALFTSDGINLCFHALTAHFGQWLEGRRGRKARQWRVAVGLIYPRIAQRDEQVVGLEKILVVGPLFCYS
jgi:hypothetical protein